MKATLIYNPTAGMDKPHKDELINLFNEKGYEVKFVNSDADDISQQLEDPGELIAIAGGDGTIAKIARKLIGRDVPIGILSIGTANNIAMAFDACGSPQHQINSWNLSRLRPFNVGLIKGNWGKEYFFESVGFGLLPALVKKAKKKQKIDDPSFDTRREKIDYSLEIVEEIIHQLPIVHYQIELDGKDFSGNYFLVEVMNIKSIGPHLFLAPDANPGDDLFDVVLMTEGQQELLLQFVKKRLRGEEAVLDVKRIQASQISISTDKAKIHIDDEIEKVKGEIHITMEKSKLSVL